MIEIISKNYERLARMIPGLLWPMRLYFFRLLVGKIGKGVKVSVDHVIMRPHLMHFGDYVFINTGFYCATIRKLTIEDRVMFGSNCSIIGGDHNYSDVTQNMRFTHSLGEDREIKIESDAWIGHGTTILKRAIIREGAIIGAGSVVNSDVKPYSVYAGSPAKFIKPRFKTWEDLVSYLEMMKEEYGFESRYSTQELENFFQEFYKK